LTGPILSIDTGILLSAISVIVTIFLFIFKTQSTKSEKAIVISETVKKNEESIRIILKQLDNIQAKLNINDIDIITVKKDIEFLKTQDIVDKKDIERLFEKIEKFSIINVGGRKQQQQNHHQSSLSE
jgi:hypothetical protein